MVTQLIPRRKIHDTSVLFGWTLLNCHFVGQKLLNIGNFIRVSLKKNQLKARVLVHWDFRRSEKGV